MIGAAALGLAVVGVVLAILHGLARSRWDATALLSLFAACVMLLPARLIFPGLGAWGTPATAVALIGGVWWCLGTLFRWVGLSLTRQPVRDGVFIFVILSIFSYTVAAWRPLTGEEAGSASRALIEVFVFASVALLAADGIASRDRLETLLQRICLFGSIIATVGVVQYVTGYDPVAHFERLPFFEIRGGLFALRSRGDVRRVVATADHPIEFGVVVALLFPLALHYARFARDRSDAIKRWAQVGLIGAAIPMSVSRSALLAAIVAAIVLAFGWTWRQRLNAIVISVAYLGAMRAMTPGLLGTLRGLVFGGDEDNSIGARTRDFDAVLEYFRDSPWVGRGLNTFVPSQYPLLDNQWFRVALEQGIYGLVALAGLFGCAFAAARVVVRTSTSESTRDLARTLSAIVLGAAASFATYDAWFYRINAAMLALTIGCCGALWRLTRIEVEAEPERQLGMSSSPVSLPAP